MNQGADAPFFFLDHFDEPVAGLVAPGGDVFQDAGVVSQDFQEISGTQALHLPGGEQDRDRAEEAEDVEVVRRLGQRGSPGRSSSYNTNQMQQRWIRFFAPLACGIALAASPAAAWTPTTQLVIGREAAALAPPDMARQIHKHKKAFEEGLLAPFQDSDAGRHMKNPDGSGSLDKVFLAEVQAAIQDIRQHRPFEEVVRRLGVISHYMADANNPLAASGADAEEGRYFVDYLRYAESAEPRFPLVFYGAVAGLERQKDISPLLQQALQRGRELYPLVGREYRRIDFASGRARFDDRSSAFGVASLSFSHAVTDVAQTLRYIWLVAGGTDGRQSVVGRHRLLVLPRAERTR